MDNKYTKQIFKSLVIKDHKDNLILVITHKIAKNAKFPWITWDGEVGIFIFC